MPPGIFDVPADDECDPQGWYGEQTLDIEAIHAMAPGANVLYVGGEDCNEGIDAALNHIVAGRLADIVNNSYGSTGEDIDPAEVRIFGAITLQGALEGIGLYFSSGDDGDESINLDQPSVDFEPSLPWVTGVGGTSLAVGPLRPDAVRAGLGDRLQQLRRRRLRPAGAGRVLLRLRWWHQPAVRAALVPAPGRAAVARHQVEPHPGPGRARRGAPRRPEHRLADRPDPGVHRRDVLRHVPRSVAPVSRHRCSPG